jgi:hypothetical protein
MSWSDAIKDAVGNLVGEAERAALPGLVKKVLGNEGLQSILAKLQDAGKAPRHRGKGRWFGDFWHRRQGAGHEDRDSCGLAGLWRHAGFV